MRIMDEATDNHNYVYDKVNHAQYPDMLRWRGPVSQNGLDQTYQEDRLNGDIAVPGTQGGEAVSCSIRHAMEISWYLMSFWCCRNRRGRWR